MSNGIDWALPIETDTGTPARVLATDIKPYGDKPNMVAVAIDLKYFEEVLKVRHDGSPGPGHSTRIRNIIPSRD